MVRELLSGMVNVAAMCAVLLLIRVIFHDTAWINYTAIAVLTARSVRRSLRRSSAHRHSGH